ncbi:predicted protein [Histoplasma capsulatum G186AR]|uniref:Uncharacterized protein n=1 Tax=Ajellomyces capsulatus (strain G186AR / H82 / ATCC MYA-2454 / RMSCC 2432) TaxID=447093 RepID=C0NJV5_AJECG|nr:uncharacterized protein HCBG_03435 [Histoplasma capsulatum G186AR]EEH08146.1 predicted protein [Histoplasma capsulatum G186AR]
MACGEPRFLTYSTPRCGIAKHNTVTGSLPCAEWQPVRRNTYVKLIYGATVTGAHKGIGQAEVITLAEAGASLILIRLSSLKRSLLNAASTSVNVLVNAAGIQRRSEGQKFHDHASYSHWTI